MAITWIVTADSARARVLQVADRERLVEIDDVPPERVGEFLEEARVERRYDKLYLSAPPTILGQLGEEVRKLVCEELDKELYRANARELERYFASRPAR